MSTINTDVRPQRFHRENIRADEIIKALAGRHPEGGTGDRWLFLTEVKNGPTQSVDEYLRLDALAIKKSWAHPCLQGYEVKVSRSDFVADTKWPAYRDLCNLLSFACPKDLIQPEELPDDIGLVYYNPEKRALQTVRKARFREIKVPTMMLFYIIMNRLDSDRHPFFSDTRAMFEAWLQDKVDRRSLGRRVSIRLVKEINEARDEVDRLKRALEAVRSDDITYLKERLGRAGVNVGGWHWEEQLELLLSTRLPTEFYHDVRVLADVVGRLSKRIEEVKNMGAAIQSRTLI